MIGSIKFTNDNIENEENPIAYAESTSEIIKPKYLHGRLMVEGKKQSLFVKICSNNSNDRSEFEVLDSSLNEHCYIMIRLM
ncbi:hypothetical protein RhiirA4_459502 [Rhizophagus irregularis]|uniref:Uncharacterized protein n=1 Tax=Rhizophagus irregularis TaxID=588596 RepID=A0A2I1GEJ7_9GLOM|nr:hypothetical protein RhiirA4_459502 [Rhizophagus irregularis]